MKNEVKWFSIKDKYPTMYFADILEDDATDYAVLVYTKRGIIKIATLEVWDCEEEPEWYDNSSEHWNITDEVIYWAELPTPPKENL